MKFVCYTDWVQLPESANALFEQAEKNSIFFSRPWFENLAAVGLDDDQSMLLACVVAENKVMAILPLIKRADKNNGYALRHRYTPHYSLLISDEDQQQVLACLAKGLKQLPVNALLLEPIVDEDNSMIALQQSLQTAGYQCERVFRFYNWILRLQGQSYEEYMAARPARLRNTISRKKRKLEREHGYDIRLFTGEEVPQAMSDYYAVFKTSWKVNEQYVDFLDGMVASFSRVNACGPGWSRLAVLYVAGQPAAAQLWFVHHGKASIFRLAYDEAWKKYSPGSILTSFLMEYVIDTDKVEEIDFLTGNEAYKPDWMSDRRECFALSCVKQAKPTGKYRGLVKSLKRILKSQ